MSRCSDTSVNRLTEKTGPLKDAVMATWQLKKKKKKPIVRYVCASLSAAPSQSY